MLLGRLFGGTASAARHSDAAEGASEADAATLRRIVTQLDGLTPEQRTFVAAFAYVLGRVANADLTISPAELELMERTVMGVAGLSEAEAVLVVQIALNHTTLYGGTDDYTITREFARMSTREQLGQVLRAAFAIGAADLTINAQESAELDEIGRELGFSDAEVRSLRAEYTESFAAVREVRRARESGRT